MQLTCPKCQGAMRQYERAGVTVDQCGECRGLYLDRGELERLIDAENSWHAGAGQRQQPPQPQYQQSPFQPRRDHDSDGYPKNGQGHKKHRSFLGELFD